MAAVELRTLGQCQIVLGRERIGPHSPHGFALSLYLCTERGRPHPRDELLPIFFPGVASAKAAHSLRQSIYKLRQAGLPSETTPAGTIVPAAVVRDDFSALLATSELPEMPDARLPGEFLPGYWPKISDEFTRWLESQRDAVNSALRRAYIARIAARRSVARWDQVEQYARACLAIDPLNEEATLALAEALALSGSKAAGVKVLDQFIADVGTSSAELSIPAGILRKRISERVPTGAPRYSEPTMVGRESELQTLVTALMEAKSGFPSSINVWGEAGIGKTRIIREFLSSIQLTGAHVAQVSSQPHDLRRPMSMLVDLVPQLLKLPGVIGAHPASLTLLKQLLTASYDAPLPTTSDGAATAEELGAAIAHAVSDVLDAVACDRLLVLVLDDFHWADLPSRRIVEHLLAERKRRRVLVLASSRTPLASLSGVSELAIPGLHREDAILFVQRCLAGRTQSSPQAVVDQIVSLSGGNPLYLTSLCDYYADKGSLEETPPQLRDLVLQRVKVLTPHSRTVLGMCAVLGRFATIARLQTALGIPCYALAISVAELETNALVSLSGDKLHMKHDLLTAALLDHLSEAELIVLRRAAAVCLESESQHAGDILILWNAAEQWSACGEPLKAKALFRNCCLHAARVGAVVECFDSLARFAAVASDAEVAELSASVCAMIRFGAIAPEHLIDWRSMRLGSFANSDFAHDFELTLLDASHHYRGDSGQYLEYLRSIFQNPNLARRARFRASAIAMATAEDHDDPELASEIIAAMDVEVVSRIPVEHSDADAIRLHLMYHTYFGDRDKSVRLAREILQWSDTCPLSGEPLRSLVNASIALGYAGQLEAASCGFTRCLTLLPEGARQRSMVIAYQAWLARQCGFSSETEWKQLLLETAPMGEIGTLDSMALYYLARRSLDEADKNAAQAIIDVLNSRIHVKPQTAHWAMLGALNLRLEVQIRGIEPAEAHVADLARWSLRTAPRYSEDDVAFSVGLALSRICSSSGAATFLAQYNAIRREGLPMLPSLKWLIQADT